MSPPATSGINPPFGGLSPSLGQVAYVLLNRLPLNNEPKLVTPLDLHTLGTPLAFVLSQDQTLHPNWIPIGSPPKRRADDREKGMVGSAAEADRTGAVPHSSVSLLSHCSVFKDLAREDAKNPRRLSVCTVCYSSTRFP